MSVTTISPQQNRPLPVFLEDFFRSNAWVLFGFSCLIYGMVQYIQQNLIITEEVYYTTLGEQLTIDRIEELLQRQQQWNWVGYPLIPVALAIQIFLITICLNTGTILMDYKVSFRQLFSLVTKAIVVLAVGKAVYIFTLLTIDVHTLEDVFEADFFSLLGWVGKDKVVNWLWYPLGVINVFELLFWLVLAAGLTLLLRLNYKAALRLLVGTYGVGLILWILLVVFLQLNFAV